MTRWRIGSRCPKAVVSPDKIAPGHYQRSTSPKMSLVHYTFLVNFIAALKIVASFSGSTATGSGVLIDKWTVAIAGHVLMNQRGHAKNVVIWTGLGARDSMIKSRNVTHITPPLPAHLTVPT
ncbi:hypothetical protein HD806DRAFT_542104 [Xylariaceae sp. AK1471]|nr:hypothetical protein HD806DRAFT_542104 [Xylariaceae sp. AK1471]